MITKRLVPVLVLAWAGASLLALLAVATYARRGNLGGDALAYWRSGHSAALYDRLPGQWGAYLYSPAFAQAIKPATLLPATTFAVAWTVAEALAFIWLVRPLGLAWGGPMFLLCVPELAWGNLYGFYAVVLVVGFRYPGAWALPALTKIAPAVGLVWFAARREWRALTIALGVIVAIALASFLLAPGEWSDWYSFLHRSATRPVVAFRETCGIIVAFIAARLNVRWLLTVAMILACPLLNDLVAVSLLAAVPRMAQSATPQPRNAPVAAGVVQ